MLKEVKSIVDTVLVVINNNTNRQHNTASIDATLSYMHELYYWCNKTTSTRYTNIQYNDNKTQ